MVLCGDPLHRPYLIHFANTLSKSHSPTFFATIKTDTDIYRTNVNKFHQQNYGNYLPRHLLNTNKKGFFESVFAESFRHGVTMLMQCVGLGALRPNTLLLGYRHNWKLNLKLSHQYVDVIRDALEMGYAVMLLRNFSYIDWTMDQCYDTRSDHTDNNNTNVHNDVIDDSKTDDVFGDIELGQISQSQSQSQSDTKTGNQQRLNLLCKIKNRIKRRNDLDDVGSEDLNSMSMLTKG